MAEYPRRGANSAGISTTCSAWRVGFGVFAAPFARLCAPQGYSVHHAVRLTLGAHQSVPTHVHRRCNLGLPHHLQLHADRRFGVVEPRPIGVAEGVPPHAVILPGCRPALPMRSNQSLVTAVLRGAGKVSLVVYEHLSQAVLEADAPGRDVNYVTVWVDNHI